MCICVSCDDNFNAQVVKPFILNSLSWENNEDTQSSPISKMGHFERDWYSSRTKQVRSVGHCLILQSMLYINPSPRAVSRVIDPRSSNVLASKTSQASIHVYILWRLSQMTVAVFHNQQNLTSNKCLINTTAHNWQFVTHLQDAKRSKESEEWIMVVKILISNHNLKLFHFWSVFCSFPRTLIRLIPI